MIFLIKKIFLLILLSILLIGCSDLDKNKATLPDEFAYSNSINDDYLEQNLNNNNSFSYSDGLGINETNQIETLLSYYETVEVPNYIPLNTFYSSIFVSNDYGKQNISLSFVNEDYSKSFHFDSFDHMPSLSGSINSEIITLYGNDAIVEEFDDFISLSFQKNNHYYSIQSGNIQRDELIRIAGSLEKDRSYLLDFELDYSRIQSLKDLPFDTYEILSSSFRLTNEHIVLNGEENYSYVKNDSIQINYSNNDGELINYKIFIYPDTYAFTSEEHKELTLSGFDYIYFNKETQTVFYELNGFHYEINFYIDNYLNKSEILDFLKKQK